MGFLKDVAYHHMYQNRSGTCRSAHVLHPFTNSIGEHKGKYEILRTLDKKQKLSIHVVDAQLAEMFAHNIFEIFRIRLRMKDPSEGYPTAPPGLIPNHQHIIPNSNFSRAVAAIDTNASLSSEIKELLRKLDVFM